MLDIKNSQLSQCYREVQQIMHIGHPTDIVLISMSIRSLLLHPNVLKNLFNVPIIWCAICRGNFIMRSIFLLLDPPTDYAEHRTRNQTTVSTF